MTEGNQILLRISSTMAPKQPMMNLQLLHAATNLAPPTVSFEDLESELLGHRYLELVITPHFAA